MIRRSGNDINNSYNVKTTTAGLIYLNVANPIERARARAEEGSRLPTDSRARTRTRRVCPRGMLRLTLMGRRLTRVVGEGVLVGVGVGVGRVRVGLGLGLGRSEARARVRAQVQVEV